MMREMRFASMREAFAHALIEEGEENDAIVALVADTFKRISSFAQRFPRRAFNVGIAEQNLIGVAAGLALSGKIPVVSSIGTFVTMRCFEQIRNDVGYQATNVKIVGTECGVNQGKYGATHLPVEDIALMRCIPRFAVLAPADPYETYAATKALLRHSTGGYMRLGSEPNRMIYDKDISFELGKIRLLQEGGKEVALLACGAMVEVALDAAHLLRKEGIMAWVADVHTIKPLDTEAIAKLAGSVRHLFTLEEHMITGGLGSAVAEVVAAQRASCVLQRFALPDEYLPVGSKAELLDYCGLTPLGVCQSVLAAIRE